MVSTWMGDTSGENACSCCCRNAGSAIYGVCWQKGEPASWGSGRGWNPSHVTGHVTPGGLLPAVRPVQSIPMTCDCNTGEALTCSGSNESQGCEAARLIYRVVHNRTSLDGGPTRYKVGGPKGGLNPRPTWNHWKQWAIGPSKKKKNDIHQWKGE